MRALVVGLLLGNMLFAQDYPRAAGFVNDFANQLPLSTVQALEKKVRDYERATGNEVAVAVVSSLNGMPVDEYAQGLFRAWGVGKYGVNNGVLFLWAPKERQIRIHVGRGLEAVLTKAVTDRMVLRVRDRFRANQFEEGVNGAVDEIIENLGTGAGAATSAGPNFIDRNSPAELERQRQDALREQQAAEQERAASARQFLIAIAVAVGIGLIAVLMVRRSRAARWREGLSRDIGEADRALAEAERKRAAAQTAFAELQKEAPEEVWGGFRARLSDAPPEVARQRTTLDQMRTMPRETYGELHAVKKMLDRWQQRMESASMGLGEIGVTLEAFRQRRQEARAMLDAVASELVRLEGRGVPAESEGMLRAAADTYNQARQESSRTPANWLLVYDLLADVGACLEQIENPSRVRYQPARYWHGYQDSPASTALALMYMASMSSGSSRGEDFDMGSSGGGDSGGGFSGGGDSGGGDSGGFGGGDSGGGGSSSDY